MVAVEGGVSSRGDIVAFHEAFGKIFRTFQLCTHLRRTNNLHIAEQTMILEIICDTFNERHFWSNNHHVNFVVDDKVCHLIEVSWRYLHIFSNGRRAGITRTDVEFFDFWTLCYFPC